MSTNSKGYSAIPLVEPADMALAGIAGSYMQSKLPEAMQYSHEKVQELQQLVEEGEYSWRVLGLIAGLLLIVTSFFEFLSDFFGLSPFSAVLDLYLLGFGLCMTLLEYKEMIFTDSWLRVIRREALFLYRPYGRAGFYFFVGILEVVKGGLIGFIIGIYTAFIGAIIYRGSRQATRALDELKRQGKFTEADIVRKFHEFDKSGKGQLDVKDLSKLCESLGYSLNRNELESALFILDGNRNGKISLEEFKYWWSNKDDPI